MILLLALVSFVAPVRAQRSSTSLYVAPGGSDSWSGRIPRPTPDRSDGPLASLRGARDAVRRLHASAASPRDTVRVVFASGTYRMVDPVVFGPDDGGTEMAPVVYEAAPGADVVLSGGKTIAVSRGANGAWRATLPEVASGAWYFNALWVNGRRAVRARWPNSEPAYLAGPAPGADTASRPYFDQRAVQLAPRDFAELRLAPGERLDDVTFVVYHSWETSRLQLAALDPRTRTINTAVEASWPFFKWGTRQRYHLENFRAALDAPGEWYLGRDGALTYLPRRGERLERDAVTAPVAERFLEVRGTLERPVEYLTFRGLRFRYAQFRPGPTGHNEYQAAFTVGAAIEATHARHLRLEDVEIGSVGGYALWFGRGCQDCHIERSYLHDLGAGGVRIGEGVAPDTAHLADVARGNVVDNNIIRGGGRTFPGGVGVWVGQSGDNAITHNDISDLYYSGVSVGWTWGYGPSAAQRNIVDFNDIHDVGQGMLSDLGGVYTLGPSAGTVVRGNVVRGVRSFDCYGRGGWGLYNDEGSSDIVFEDNLVYDVSTGPYHQHYGRGNVVRNNILALGHGAQLQRTRPEDSTSLTLTGNLIYWRGGSLMVGAWDSPLVTVQHNLYWNTSGSVPRPAHDTTSIVADPRFENPKKGDFRLKANSPAATIGFIPFEAHAGVYGERWTTLARDLAREQLEPPADAKGWGACKQ